MLGEMQGGKVCEVVNNWDADPAWKPAQFAGLLGGLLVLVVASPSPAQPS